LCSRRYATSDVTASAWVRFTGAFGPCPASVGVCTTCPRRRSSDATYCHVTPVWKAPCTSTNVIVCFDDADGFGNVCVVVTAYSYLVRDQHDIGVRSSV